MKIKQLLLLYSSQVSNRQIAKRLGISRNTVNRYIKFFNSLDKSQIEFGSISEKDLVSMFVKQEKLSPRLQQLKAYFPTVKKDMLRPGFTYRKTWEEYQEIYDDGYGYSQFMEHFHRWNQSSEASLKLHHKSGEKLMVDYAGKKLYIVDKHTGEQIPVETFVGCLPASGFTYVEATATQQKEDFINSVTNNLEYIGGVPEMIVPDNLKSAVTKSSKYEPIANRSLRDLGLHYGAILNPTRPYSPKDKALVERTVRLVYEQIYFPMRDEIYHTLEELNERILELLEVFNNRKLSQLNCSRKELFYEIERGLLKPLPPQAYQLKEYKRGKVQKMSHVYLSIDKHYYSVPHRYVGKRVQIHYSHRIVEVYYNHQRIATHFRSRIASGYTTNKKHLPAKHQFYLEWNPELFINEASQIGPYTKQYIERLFQQKGHPQTKYKTAMGIIQLKKYYEYQRIENACRLGMVHPISSYQRVSSILEKNIDSKADLFQVHLEDNINHIPIHENIRGQNHYLQIIQNNNQHESDHSKNDSNAFKANGTNPSSKAN